jgi:hypothetical protein
VEDSKTNQLYGKSSRPRAQRCLLTFPSFGRAFDQTNRVAEICALPALASSCSLIASYFTEEYKGRTWCQAELLMARAFCALRPLPIVNLTM